MALFSVFAAPHVLVLIAVPFFQNTSGPRSDEVICAEDVEGQPAKGVEAEVDPRTRESCPEVHEGVVVMEDSGRGGGAHKIVLTGSTECPEVYVSGPATAPAGVGPQRRRSRNRSLCSNEHHHLHAETSCGGEDERPTTHMHQNLLEEASSYHDHSGNNPLDQQPDFPAATTGRGALEQDENNRVIDMNSELDGRVSREERNRETEAEEEMKHTLKFSYFSTGIAGAGIIGIFSGYLGGQTGNAHTIPFKVCTFFMLATFVSGAAMLLLTFLHLSSRICIKIFRSLKYITLGFLTLAMLDISFLFLKIFAILAFVPTLFIVMIAFFMALCQNGLPWSHH